ncbi:polyprenyl synthetase family protein [Leucobacter sp.]
MAVDRRTADPQLAPLEPPANAAPPIRADTGREIGLEIRALLDGRASRAAAYGPSFAELWECASRCAQGGKLLRPRLLLDAFDALGGDASRDSARRRSALRIAAAVEILHFSFLLHDDVIDEDLLRRGTPNLIGELFLQQESAVADRGLPAGGGPRNHLHWARSNGILVGDAMLALAHQVFAREPLPEGLRLRLLELLDHAITESIAGEHADVGLSDGVMPAEMSAVLEMTRLKTATYTFELPLRAAAVLAEAGPRAEAAIAAIARRLGVAFQLQDDLLSAFSPSAEHGKDPFSDFREGKETAIIAYARMTSVWPGIESRFGAADFAEDDGRAIRELLASCGAEDFIRSLVDEHLRAALELVSAVDSAVPVRLVDHLLQLVETLEARRF